MLLSRSSFRDRRAPEMEEERSGPRSEEERSIVVVLAEVELQLAHDLSARLERVRVEGSGLSV